MKFLSSHLFLFLRSITRWHSLMVLAAVMIPHHNIALTSFSEPSHERICTSELSKKLEIGDLIFTHIPVFPFKKVALITNCWANHVGIVVDVSGKEAIIAESTFPLSRTTSLSRFISRSENRRVAVNRLNRPLKCAEKKQIVLSAQKRLRIFYDTGFNLYSRRQFCSRFVYEVIKEALGLEIGKVISFKTLLSNNQNIDLTFWRFWYFGKIPWERKTLTPASVLMDPNFHSIFDGFGQNSCPLLAKHIN